MRKIAWWLLVFLAFTIPWEYSLELGGSLGNIARVVGLILIPVALLAVWQRGRWRTPGPLHWLMVTLYLWLCCTYFWTIDPVETLGTLRAYFQVMMIVWAVWEFAETPRDLRTLLRAYVAGSWVLAILTVANLVSTRGAGISQIRFAAEGQDPNDVARFLDLGFPMAALLLSAEPRWPGRLLAWGYLPLGLIAVLLTASRGGFVAAVIALVGCSVLLMRRAKHGVLLAALGLPVLAASAWFAIPHATIERLGTLYEQLQGGNLNQRANIWIAGWHAFVQAPWLGTGAGTFVEAAGLAPADTAHNTALSILVGGGIVALLLATAVFAFVASAILRTSGALQMAMTTALLIWGISSLVATVEENRTTWLLLALIALAGRLAVETPEGLAACFQSDTEDEPVPHARHSLRTAG